ncbi:hypothetical protein [Kordiimonas lacus]|uniref:Uncharacterized protein n=1 Tax=Kordiimonas lacus TaxID=637679 RepID=A0A1G6TIG5_9PROT|nr:hypothetical protein [Kordiimonas lacus]SDD28831.1 hypothetical protein SAMN04488071_0247 [Kordiimonas lacus]
MTQNTIPILDSFLLVSDGTVVFIDPTDVLSDPLPKNFPVTVLMPTGDEFKATARPLLARKPGTPEVGIALELDGVDEPIKLPMGSKLILPNF